MASDDLKQTIIPDPSYLIKLAETRMPFGKHKGCLLVDLPEPYVIWLCQKDLPGGELRDMLRAVYEIKVNGLEYLFRPLRKRSGEHNGSL